MIEVVALRRVVYLNELLLRTDAGRGNSPSSESCPSPEASTGVITATGAGTGTTTVTGAGTGMVTRVGVVCHGDSVGSGAVQEGQPRPCGLPVRIALGDEPAEVGEEVAEGTGAGALVGSSTGLVGKACRGLCTVGDGEARGPQDGREVVVVGTAAGEDVGSSTGRVGKL